MKYTDAKDVTPEGYRKATISEGEPATADVAAFIKPHLGDQTPVFVMGHSMGGGGGGDDDDDHFGGDFSRSSRLCCASNIPFNTHPPTPTHTVKNTVPYTVESQYFSKGPNNL